jgi:hypothetical protein
MLIRDLCECGCQLQEDFTILIPGEAPVNFWEIPWQHLKPAIFGIVARRRDADISQQRTFIDNVGEIDGPVAKKVFHHLGAKGQRVYTHIATGGFWGENDMASIRETDGKCPHCGSPHADTTHVLWECSTINQHRKERSLSEVNCRNLPKTIVNGIPIAMSASLGGTYWDSNVEDPCGCEELNNLMGCPGQRHKAKADNINGLITDAVAQDERIGLSRYILMGASARRIFTCLRINVVKL